MYSYKYKNTVVAILLACILTMAIGYAALQQRLNISGTSSISSVYDVRFTKITSTASGTATNKVAPSYTATTANFSTNLVSPGDTMTYKITVSNNGTLDAQLKLVTLSDTQNEAIDFSFYGVKEGDILPAKQKVVVTVVVRYDMSTSSQPNNVNADLSIKLDYGQRDEDTLNEVVAAGSYLRWTNTYASTEKWLNGPLVKNEIESISFTDSNIVPEDAGDNYFDISSQYDDSIMAWYYDKDGNGLYEVVIGQHNGVMANPDSQNLFCGLTNLKSIDFTNFYTTGVTDMSYMFKDTYNLTSLDLSGFDTSNVTNMSHMFRDIRLMENIDMSNWDTGNVTNMSDMFATSSSIYNVGGKLKELDLSHFDTSSVTDMSGMFAGQDGLTKLDISNFDTSNVKNMSSMFTRLYSLKELDLSNFDTSKVTNMADMFKNSKFSKLNISSFNTSKVKDMSSMFQEFGHYLETKLNLSHFDTSNVTDMSDMFRQAELDNLIITNLNTSNVTNMSGTFYSAYLKDGVLDLTNWNVPKLENAYEMFASSSIKGLDISTWKTPNLKNMNKMFNYMYSVKTIDISNLDTRNVTNMDNLFVNSDELETIYVGDNFITSSVTGTGNLFGNNLALVGAVPFDSSKLGLSMANYTTGYFTYKANN